MTFDAVFRHFDYGADGFVFCTAFDQYVGAPARGLNFKFAIAEEEGCAGAAFEHGIARVTKTTVGGQDVYFGVDVFAGRAVNNMSVQGAHRTLRLFEMFYNSVSRIRSNIPCSPSQSRKERLIISRACLQMPAFLLQPPGQSVVVFPGRSRFAVSFHPHLS